MWSGGESLHFLSARSRTGTAYRTPHEYLPTALGPHLTVSVSSHRARTATGCKLKLGTDDRSHIKRTSPAKARARARSMRVQGAARGFPPRSQARPAGLFVEAFRQRRISTDAVAHLLERSQVGIEMVCERNTSCLTRSLSSASGTCSISRCRSVERRTTLPSKHGSAVAVVISINPSSVSACRAPPERGGAQLHKGLPVSGARVRRARRPSRRQLEGHRRLEGGAPGARPSTKPKSMWTSRPSRSIRMLPLCRSLMPSIAGD